jgi:hypothetical protein
MKDQLFLALGTIRANPISGSALNLFQLAHLLPETVLLGSLSREKDANIGGRFC